MSGLGIKVEVQKFFETKNIKDESDFALLAVDEKEVKSEIFEMMKAGGFELKEPSEGIAIKKLWISCRRAHASDSSGPSAATPQAESTELSPEQALDLKTMWVRDHGYVPPENQLLSKTLTKTLWKAANMSPPQLESVLMENLRLLGQKSKPAGQLLDMHTMTKTRVESDMIFGPMEVYARARAYFLTLAYVSIRNKGWFDLQNAIFAAEKVFELVQRTTDAASPPISHFIKAWAATVTHLAERVRVGGGSLNDAVLNTGQWEHRWEWAPATGAATGSGMDLPSDVQCSVKEAQEQARMFQSMVDKQKFGEGGAHRVSRGDTRKKNQFGGGKFNGGGKGKYNGGKNKGKYNGGKGNGGGSDRRSDHDDRRSDRPRSRDRSRGRR